jgi:hypothetical protein
MRSRLILSHMLPVLIATPLMAIVLISVLETQVVLVNLSTSLLRQAALIAETASDHPTVWQDANAAQAFVKRFRLAVTAQVMVLDVTGRLLASSDQQMLLRSAKLSPSLGCPRYNGATSVSKSIIARIRRAKWRMP